MTKISTRPWNSATHLRTEEEMASYLDAVLEEAGDDPKFIAHALRVIVRACMQSQRQVLCLLSKAPLPSDQQDPARTLSRGHQPIHDRHHPSWST